MEDAFGKGASKVEYYDYYKYRISYLSEKDSNLLFLFITGLTDNFDNIKKELIKCKKEFLALFQDILSRKFDAKTFEVFDPTIDSIHRNLRPKISLVGFSGVGKTTITKLIKAEEIPMTHIPTITGDIATIKIGKLHFHLWDFAGQEQFSYLWNNFIKGSDAVLLITDSSLENVEKSKFFLELIKEQAPHAHTAVIGNKQDLPEAISPIQIEKILGLKTYSMIANDPGNRDKMFNIIADILEMSAEVSPLLKPLLERDQLMIEAKDALEKENFEKAASLFEKISDLCIDLGDDSLGGDFNEKSLKIKEMLKKVSIKEVSTPAEKKIPSKTLITPEQPVSFEKPLSLEKPSIVEQTVPPEQAEPLEKPLATEQPTTSEQSKPSKQPAIEQPFPSETVSDKPIAKLSSAKKPKVKPLPQSKPVIKPTVESIQKIPGVPQTKIPLKEPEPLKTPVIIRKESQEPEPLIKPTKTQKSAGLKLNPEDFMIKQRPKSVGDVPKDAKSKLKTTPYGQVRNEPKPETQKPESLTQLPPIQPAGSIQPKKPTSPVIPQVNKPVIPSITSQPSEKVPQKIEKMTVPTELAPELKPDILEPISSTLNAVTPTPTTIQQKANLEQSLMDLRIQKANLSKLMLDLEMKELTGEISSEELNEKKKKLLALEDKINQQIQDIQKLLNA